MITVSCLLEACTSLSCCCPKCSHQLYTAPQHTASPLCAGTRVCSNMIKSIGILISALPKTGCFYPGLGPWDSCLAQLQEHIYSGKGRVSLGAWVRILLQNDSLKSSSERRVSKHAQSFPCAGTHVQVPFMLWTDRAQTLPCPEAVQRHGCNHTCPTNLFFLLGRGGPKRTAASAQQPDWTQEYTVIHCTQSHEGLTERGEIGFSQMELQLMTEPWIAVHTCGPHEQSHWTYPG